MQTYLGNIIRKKKFPMLVFTEVFLLYYGMLKRIFCQIAITFDTEPIKCFTKICVKRKT